MDEVEVLALTVIFVHHAVPSCDPRRRPGTTSCPAAARTSTPARGSYRPPTRRGTSTPWTGTGTGPCHVVSHWPTPHDTNSRWRSRHAWWQSPRRRKRLASVSGTPALWQRDTKRPLFRGSFAAGSGRVWVGAGAPAGPARSCAGNRPCPVQRASRGGGFLRMCMEYEKKIFWKNFLKNLFCVKQNPSLWNSEKIVRIRFFPAGNGSSQVHATWHSCCHRARVTLHLWSNTEFFLWKRMNLKKLSKTKRKKDLFHAKRR